MPSRFFGTLFVVLALVVSSSACHSPTAPSGGGGGTVPCANCPPEKPPWIEPPAGYPWGTIASIGVRVDNGSMFGLFIPPEGLREPVNVRYLLGLWVPVSNRPLRVKETFIKDGVVRWTTDNIETHLLAGIEQYSGQTLFNATKGEYHDMVETWDQTAPAGQGYTMKEEVFIVK